MNLAVAQSSNVLELLEDRFVNKLMCCVQFQCFLRCPMWSDRERETW